MGSSKYWKVCGPTEKSRSESGKRRVCLVRFATVDVNMYCFGFSAGVWDMGFCFDKGRLQDGISSFAHSCVVLRGCVL